MRLASAVATLLFGFLLASCGGGETQEAGGELRSTSVSDPTDSSVSFGVADDDAAEADDDALHDDGGSPDEASDPGAAVEPQTTSTESAAEETSVDADEQAIRDAVNGMHDAWVMCSIEPSECDPEIAYGSFMAIDSEAYGPWADQVDRWRATRIVSLIPEESALDNFQNITSVRLTGDNADVTACLRDAMAEHSAVIEGEPAMIDETYSPGDFLMRYRLERTEVGWRITEALILEEHPVTTEDSGICRKP